MKLVTLLLVIVVECRSAGSECFKEDDVRGYRPLYVDLQVDRRCSLRDKTANRFQNTVDNSLDDYTYFQLEYKKQGSPEKIEVCFVGESSLGHMIFLSSPIAAARHEKKKNINTVVLVPVLKKNAVNTTCGDKESANFFFYTPGGIEGTSDFLVEQMGNGVVKINYEKVNVKLMTQGYADPLQNNTGVVDVTYLWSRVSEHMLLGDEMSNKTKGSLARKVTKAMQHKRRRREVELNTELCTHKTESDYCCYFPFIYKGETHNDCAGNGWCATEPDEEKRKTWPYDFEYGCRELDRPEIIINGEVGYPAVEGRPTDEQCETFNSYTRNSGGTALLNGQSCLTLKAEFGNFWLCTSLDGIENCNKNDAGTWEDGGIHWECINPLLAIVKAVSACGNQAMEEFVQLGDAAVVALVKDVTNEGVARDGVIRSQLYMIEAVEERATTLEGGVLAMGTDVATTKEELNEFYEGYEAWVSVAESNSEELELKTAQLEVRVRGLEQWAEVSTERANKFHTAIFDEGGHIKERIKMEHEQTRYHLTMKTEEELQSMRNHASTLANKIEVGRNHTNNAHEKLDEAKETLRQAEERTAKRFESIDKSMANNTEELKKQDSRINVVRARTEDGPFEGQSAEMDIGVVSGLGLGVVVIVGILLIVCCK